MFLLGVLVVLTVFFVWRIGRPIQLSEPQPPGGSWGDPQLDVYRVVDATSTHDDGAHASPALGHHHDFGGHAHHSSDFGSHHVGGHDHGGSFDGGTH